MTSQSSLRRLMILPSKYRRMISWLPYKVVVNEENRV
jgi:hypothetical protein